MATDLKELDRDLLKARAHDIIELARRYDRLSLSEVKAEIEGVITEFEKEAENGN